MNKQAEWFEDWFDSVYYHQLYKNRDDNEARFFISNLLEFIHLNSNSSIWDLACGKGRHSRIINEHGFKVVGTDLSKNSIEEASKFTNVNLDFFVHDMRTPFRINYFDAVFNLFTSIGYFENENDNLHVFRNVFSSLKPNGYFVIDFFNAIKVQNQLVKEASINTENIIFHINKSIQNNRIIKKIEFNDGCNKYYFEEKVFLYKKDDFLKFSIEAGFELLHVFGSYDLKEFDEISSDRLILIFRKK